MGYETDQEAFETVSEALKHGQPLTHEMVGSVFGSQFWSLLVYTMLDSNDAARAIQGAINRLRDEETDGYDEAAA